MDWWDQGVGSLTPEHLRVLATAGAAGLVLVLIAIVWGKLRTRRAARLRPAQPAWKPSVRVEIARINEQIEVTTGGAVGIALLILHQLGVLLFLAVASNAIQQTFIAVAWVAGNVLWGLVVALGRQRTYIVTREGPKDQ